MLAYYAKWIPNFSEKVRPFGRASIFSLTSDATLAFQTLKSNSLKARLNDIDESASFTIECDASNYAIAAILSQKDKPIAFTSRTLSDCKTRYPTVEREATSVIEAVRRWAHHLHGKTFMLIMHKFFGIT